MADELVFTPASIIDLLSQIEEFQYIPINITESENGITLTVGESTYHLLPKNETEIEVSPDVVDQISDTTEEAYNDLAESGQVELAEPVESGIIKELIKTLAIGGMVRFAAKQLKK